MIILHGRHNRGMIYNVSVSILLISLMLNYSTALWSKCPRHCTCRSSWIRGVTTVEVDCASKNLVAIPTIADGLPRDVTRLILYKNFLQEIPKDAFKGLRYLKEVYLYENFITKIHKDAFKKLRRLKILSLHHNRITKIENDTFSDLQSLQSLHMFSNFLEEITPSTFSGLRRLLTLSLHENHLRFIPKTSFDKLRQLQFLSLYRNHLGKISSNVFCASNSLKQLYVDQNKITDIEDGSFKQCSQLVKLTIGYNRLANVTKLTFNGLVKLEELFMNNNYLTRLPQGAFSEMRNLKQMSLKGNHLDEMENGVFVGLDQLMQLSLSKNGISTLHPGKFLGLKKLRKLFLEENKISEIYSNAFNGLENVQTLYLYRNRLSSIPAHAFKGLDSLTDLNLGVNIITSIENEAFLGLSNLQSLSLNSNKLSIISAAAFKGLSSLTKIALYFNSISYVAEGAFNSLISLKSLLWKPPVELVRFNARLRAVATNNLLCDCNALWLKNWLKNATSLVSPKISCAAPDKLKGKDVFLVRNEEFRCDPIKVVISPNTSIAAIGSNVQFKCIVKPGADFTWIHNGMIVTSDSKYSLSTSGLLKVHNLSATDQGQFVCLASNKAGLTAVSASLTIAVAPRILISPKEIMVIETPKQSVVLPCQASGSPKPQVSWIKDGIELQSDDNTLFSRDGSLIILSMEIHDQGIYTCIAKNNAGQTSVTTKVYLGQGTMCLPSCRRDSGYCVVKYECQCLPDFQGPSCEFRKNSVEAAVSAHNSSVNGKPALVVHPTAWAYETYNKDIFSASGDGPANSIGDDDTEDGDDDAVGDIRRELELAQARQNVNVPESSLEPAKKTKAEQHKPSKNLLSSPASKKISTNILPEKNTASPSKAHATLKPKALQSRNAKASAKSSRISRSPKLRNLKMALQIIDNFSDLEEDSSGVLSAVN